MSQSPFWFQVSLQTSASVARSPDGIFRLSGIHNVTENRVQFGVPRGVGLLPGAGSKVWEFSSIGPSGIPQKSLIRNTGSQPRFQNAKLPRRGLLHQVHQEPSRLPIRIHIRTTICLACHLLGLLRCQARHFEHAQD
jgi:hypothetical protein